jgi:hypothetical protein
MTQSYLSTKNTKGTKKVVGLAKLLGGGASALRLFVLFVFFVDSFSLFVVKWNSK